VRHLLAIQVFSRVVETGSFSKAAQALGIGQPAVTKHIASIERDLGVRLLNRNTRGVSVTEIGALYYERCQKILQEIDELESFVEQQKTRLEGVLRISASVSFGHKVISPLLIGFAEHNSDIRVDLRCGNPYADLIAQGVDVAIRMGKLPDSSLGSRPVGTSPWGMIASPGYLKTHGEPASIAELASRDGLIYSSLHNDQVWNHRLPSGERRLIQTRERMRSNNLTAILDATSAGLGIAIVPLYLAVPALRAGRVVRIMEQERLHEQEINAVFPSPRLIPPKVGAFVSFIQEKLRGEWWLRPQISAEEHADA
jgi:DNA-binding transcriptional LysR family regulator